MENTTSKVEAMKPVLLKAGIPIAVTVAGFIIARITQRKVSFSQASCLEKPEDSPETEPDDSEAVSSDNHALADSSSMNTGELQEEIINSNSKSEDIQQEMLLMNQENKVVMEINKIEVLEREIYKLQGESQRFENMVVEYLKIMELLEFSRSENGLLHRRVKRLQKKIKHLSHVLNAKNLQLKAKEAGDSRNQAELENKDAIIKQIEEDIKQVKMALDQLQHERNELINKLEMVQNEDSSKNDAEMVSMVDYKEVVHELEQLQQSKATEEKELVYLRWCNACLRHELMRRNQEDENQEIADYSSDHELTTNSSTGHHESCLRFPVGGHSHDHSKRKKLVQKFKKWSEKMKHKLDETKYNGNGNRSDSATAGGLMLLARNSCSSA